MREGARGITASLLFLLSVSSSSFPLDLDLDPDLYDVWNDWAVQCSAKQTKKWWG